MPIEAANPLQQVAEILTRHGGRCTPEEFHAAVNVTFHEFESAVYDEGHADMWESLPKQFDLLAGDCLEDCPALGSELRLLDIGCGTGLATDCLLHSAMGSRIGKIDLLDSSPSMLKQAMKRSETWGREVTQYNSLIHELPAENQYDVIVTCSVLHHVPDLPKFLSDVRAHQATGGLFLHLQDPNGDYLNDPELKRRMEEASPQPILPESVRRFSPKRIIRRLMREFTGEQEQDCVSKANASLVKSGIITSALTVAELYAITDIHVEDGGGISIERMRAWLPDYKRISGRSYGFFGQLWSTLAPSLQNEEVKLSEMRAPNGFHIGAAWKRLV